MTVLLGKVMQVSGQCSCVHKCVTVRAQGSACAQVIVQSMRRSEGDGIHAKHTGEGRSRHAPYMHVTVPIHVQEHVLTQAHRGQPRDGTCKYFVGVRVPQCGSLYLVFQSLHAQTCEGTRFCLAPVCLCWYCYCACMSVVMCMCRARLLRPSPVCLACARVQSWMHVCFLVHVRCSGPWSGWLQARA